MAAPTFSLTVTPSDGTGDIVFSENAAATGHVGRIVSFEGEDHISRPFEYRFTLEYDQPSIDFSKLVNQHAVLTVNQQARLAKDEPADNPAWEPEDDASVEPSAPESHRSTRVDIPGVLSSFCVTKKVSGKLRCEAVFVPALWRLSMSRRSRVFQNLTTQGIVTEVLKEAGFTEGTDFEFRLEGSGYLVREFCMQYQESDLDFVQRLLEYEGIFYFFDVGEKALLVFADGRTLPQVEGRKRVWYHEGLTGDADTVDRFVYSERIVPKMVTVQDYDFESFLSEDKKDHETGPESASYGRVGTRHEYGRFVESKRDWVAEHGAEPATKLSQGVADSSGTRKDELTRIAKIRAEEVETQRRTAEGMSNVGRLQPGHVFTFDGHFLYDGDYLVTSVRHVYGKVKKKKTVTVKDKDGKDQEVDQTVEQKQPVYTNTFICLPADEQYRPPRDTPVPRVPGIITAKVKGTDADDDDAEPHIDEEGRYRVKFPFDPAGVMADGEPPDEPSRSVRLAQPYAGKDYGMHFPNRGEVEMVLACLDGDPNRPLGLSVVPTPWKHSPVPNTRLGVRSQNPWTGGAQGSGRGGESVDHGVSNESRIKERERDEYVKAAVDAAAAKAGEKAAAKAEMDGKSGEEIAKARREASKKRRQELTNPDSKEAVDFEKTAESEFENVYSEEKKALDQKRESARKRAEEQARQEVYDEDFDEDHNWSESRKERHIKEEGQRAANALGTEAAFPFFGTKSVIRTRLGHQLVMDDADGGANVGVILQTGKKTNTVGTNVYWRSRVELGGYRHMSALERTLGIASSTIGFLKTAFTQDYPGVAAEMMAIMASELETGDYISDTWGNTTPVGVAIKTDKDVNINGAAGVNITSPNLFGMFSSNITGDEDDDKEAKYKAEAASKFIINTIWQDFIQSIAERKVAWDDKTEGKNVDAKTKAAYAFNVKAKKRRLSALVLTLLQRSGVNISSAGELKLMSLQSTSLAAGMGGFSVNSLAGIDQTAERDISLEANEGVTIKTTGGGPGKGRGFWKNLSKLSVIDPSILAIQGMRKALYKDKKNPAIPPEDYYPILIENEEGNIILKTAPGAIINKSEKGDVKLFSDKGTVHGWSGKNIIMEIGKRTKKSTDDSLLTNINSKDVESKMEMATSGIGIYNQEKVKLEVGREYEHEDVRHISILSNQIQIVCGDSEIIMTSEGDIKFKGKNIVFEASSNTNIKSGNMDIKCKGKYHRKAKMDKKEAKLSNTDVKISKMDAKLFQQAANLSKIG